MRVRIDKDRVVERKLDSKGRASLKELADPGETVEIAVLEVKEQEEGEMQE